MISFKIYMIYIIKLITNNNIFKNKNVFKIQKLNNVIICYVTYVTYV